MSDVSSVAGAWWTILRNPAFIARRRLAQALERFAVDPRVAGKIVLIDVGCGSKPYESLFSVGQYVGVDVEVSGHPDANKRCDLFFDGTKLPFPDAHADVVLCTQVLEHAPRPDELMAEMARVLKPGGALVLTLPFVWEEHETPYDFLRFTTFGVRRLVGDSGLQIAEQFKTAGSAETAAQVMSVYLHRAIGRSVPVWSSLVTALICAPVQLSGIILQVLIPENRELFLDTAVLAVKPAEAAA